MALQYCINTGLPATVICPSGQCQQPNLVESTSPPFVCVLIYTRITADPAVCLPSVHAGIPVSNLWVPPGLNIRTANKCGLRLTAWSRQRPYHAHTCTYKAYSLLSRILAKPSPGGLNPSKTWGLFTPSPPRYHDDPKGTVISSTVIGHLIYTAACYSPQRDLVSCNSTLWDVVTVLRLSSQPLYTSNLIVCRPHMRQPMFYIT